jgi:hypothetical protein
MLMYHPELMPKSSEMIFLNIILKEALGVVSLIVCVCVIPKTIAPQSNAITEL